MTLYQFNALDEMEQAEAVWDSIHVAERRDEDHNIILYQRDDFYIKVFYHRELNVIRKIRSFKNVSGLELYLPGININDLTQGEGGK